MFHRPANLKVMAARAWLAYLEGGAIICIPRGEGYAIYILNMRKLNARLVSKYHVVL